MQGRSYAPEIKLKVVKAVLENQKSVAQLCREHSISDSLIHTWKKLYREKGEKRSTRASVCKWRS